MAQNWRLRLLQGRNRRGASIPSAGAAPLVALAGTIAFILVQVAPPTYAQVPSSSPTPDATHAGQAITHRGSGAYLTPPPAPPAAPAAEPGAPKLDLAFEEAPVGEVVQSLLSQFAHASVVIDPRVSGDITIRSHGQLTAAELPEFLRTSLAALHLDLIQQAPNAYLLRPADAPNPGQGAEVYQPGANVRSGLVIYGLRHVAATEMARLLAPFARQGVTVQPERSRELLILSGPSDQIQSLVRTIDLLDVDWLEGISFGIVPLQYADPDALIGDLRSLFGGADGPIGSMVEFVAMPSRHAILVLAKRPERLDQARSWIAQLDRPLNGAGRIRLIQLLNADAPHLAETLNALFGQGDGHPRVTADASRNALLIDAPPASFDEIANIVRQLDQPIPQVMIQVTIAEVTLNNDFRFGVQWSFDLRDGAHMVLSEATGGGVVARFPGFATTYHGNYVDAALNALSSRTHVEVISTPVIVTLDNKEAMLQVGDEVPIVTQSAANVTTPNATVVSTVQYRDTGVVLHVTPRISAGDSVTLDVSQEASEVAQTTTSGIDSPTIQQRRFQSTVAVSNGETVALGGLIRANRTRSRAGIPLISAIPILGAPFRNTSDAVRRTELLVFLTPRILRTPAEAHSVSEDFAERLERIRHSEFINHERH